MCSAVLLFLGLPGCALYGYFGAVGVRLMCLVVDCESCVCWVSLFACGLGCRKDFPAGLLVIC